MHGEGFVGSNIFRLCYVEEKLCEAFPMKYVRMPLPDILY